MAFWLDFHNSPRFLFMADWCVCVSVSMSPRRLNSETVDSRMRPRRAWLCSDGCVGMLIYCSAVHSSRPKVSWHSNQPLHQIWMVCFGLDGHHHKSLKLCLTPSHVGIEAKLCCRDYFQRRGRYNRCNMSMWHECHVFFLVDPHSCEILSVLQWSETTCIPIESSWKGGFVVFSANPSERAVKKVIGDLRKLTRTLFFCYKRGCDSTTVKLVPSWTLNNF